MKKTFLSLICVLFAVCAAHTAWAGASYSLMGNDRILLMNNWTFGVEPFVIKVSNQGYNDTDPSLPTYWVHSAGDIDFEYWIGTNHVMRTSDNRRLWVLENCRAASTEFSGRRFIPYSSSSLSSGIIKASASVVMRNGLSSQIISPYYEDGIGVIYFDAVNAHFKSGANPVIILEIATNVTENAKLRNIKLSDEVSPEDCDWKTIPFDVLPIKNAVKQMDDADYGVESLLLEAPATTSSSGASDFFYRVKSKLNYRGPIRFRIRRTTIDPEKDKTMDAIGLVAIDNIIASYPPEIVSINLYGADLNNDYSSAGVFGRIGDASAAFLSVGQEDVNFYAHYSLLTNNAPSQYEPKVNGADFYYRWRYLSQFENGGEWDVLKFKGEENKLNSLVTDGAIKKQTNVGDLEYYVVADVFSIFYSPQDYAFDTKVGWGSDWTEEIKAVTNRLQLAEGVTLPSCGTDYFTRIREGVSDYEYIEWKAESIVGAKTNDVSAKMELIGDHMWRYSYFVTTNDIGGVVKFHFSGKKLVKTPIPYVYAAETNSWFGTSAEVPYIPYTSVGVAGGTIEQAVTLDDVGTHLVFEFNDESCSYSISHGTYQNFNLWTDAVDGFRGNSFADEANKDITDTGVSDRKKKYDADFYSWQVSTGTSALWKEAFSVNAGDEGFPIDKTFEESRTPNGWTARNGMFVTANRGSTNGLAFQMQGRGLGSLSLDKLSAGSMPQGVGSVSFSARLSQSYDLEDFAYYIDGTSLTDYGISAKIIMSELYDKNKNPADMSTVNPCVSLLGYYRAGKGAYEFRITRTGDAKLTAELYKWTLTGGKLTATRLGSKDFTNHLLVPNGQNDRNLWASAILIIYRAGSGDVKISCRLSKSLNSNMINIDSGNLTELIAVTDSDPLTKGTFGVGAKDCLARFGAIKVHSVNTSSGAPDLVNGRDALVNADDWNFEASGRWRNVRDNGIYGASTLFAQMPNTQTVELKVSTASDEDNSWKSIGWITNITSFATNSYVFAPCLADTYYIRLQAGGSYDDVARTDVVISEAEVRSWRGETPIDVDNDYGQRSNWVYTASWIESAGEVTGGGVLDVKPVGTNEYLFIFKQSEAESAKCNNVDITFVPKMDIEITRALLVGGGGGGGWTLGGGGGGGGVKEEKFAEGTILEKGKPFTIKVGGGGNNYYVNSNDGTHWKRGGNGGESKFEFIDTETGNFKTYSVKGGGGGAGWNEQSGVSGQATGGGNAQGNDNALRGNRAQGTDGQGNSGGRAYGDRAGGGGGASLNDDGLGQDGSAEKDGAGDGGAGRASDITGGIVYYGGGGGGGAGDGSKTPNSSKGGAGGIGGGGNGLEAKAQTRPQSLNGTDGLGGGGGGGSHGGKTGTSAGGRGGSGVVILRVKSASKVCTLQPARGYRDSAGEVYPISIRSPYLDDGMSTFSFSYINAHSNAVLWLQIATNTTATMTYGPLSTWTHKTPADSATWTTVAVFTFTNQNELAEGTRTHFMSLREHIVYGEKETVRGAMRLVVAPELIEKYLDDSDPFKDPDYGKITITRLYCCNEPPLDLRSWWGWNLHTEGWNTGSKEYAYINDSPDGLSCMLNFSALQNDNEHADAKGIGLGETDPADVARYAENNPFVQSPQITNGVGNVSFRARLFDTNQSPAEVVLYAGSSPRSYQPEEPTAWTRVTNFVVDAATYKTYSWKSSSDSAGYQTIRLEVPGARHGRSPGKAEAWEKPNIPKLNRVIIDEVLVSEPIVPRLEFREVRPFRTGLNAEKPTIVTNILSMDEQPITGESWGIQAEIKPQQMGDDLDTDSMKVYAASFEGVDPWGYKNWKDRPETEVFELKRVEDPTRFVFRSTYEIPDSIRTPVEKPNTCIQYFVWVKFKDKSGEWHTHELEPSEWANPSWYWPQDYNKLWGNGLVDNFSAYTILDSISPRRAWINEVDYVEYDARGIVDYSKQFIEIAIPQNANVKGWYINALCRNTTGANSKWRIATFGYGNAAVESKIGGTLGVHYTNNYTFISLRSPRTASAGNVKDADGIWTDTPDNVSYMPAGRLLDNEPYGFELVRPSDIVEHQVVIQGTNIWGSGDFGSQFTAGALANQLLNVDGAGSTWFPAGEDLAGNSSIGVFRSNGEDASCWTNFMSETASKINVLKDGTMQTLPSNWFLLPNGTNMWIYAFITGDHIWQVVGKETTTNNVVIILPYGSSTSIVYQVDNWYRVQSCKVNGVEQVPANGNTDKTWTLAINNVTNTTEVYASAGPGSVVSDKISPTDPYYPAVMDWLQQFDDNKPLYIADFMTQADVVITNLTLRSMYWLNINPTEDGWALKGGMGHGDSGDHSHVVDYVLKTNLIDGVETPVSNIIVQVFMQITNRITGEAYAPNCMQGLEPGSNSSNYNPYADSSVNWTSATFKVTAALQKPGVGNTFLPVRWFVFGPDSFDENFTAKIEIADPYSKSSPTYSQGGWNIYRNQYPIFYRWRLDEDPPTLETTEMLKADSTYK